MDVKWRVIDRTSSPISKPGCSTRVGGKGRLMADRVFHSGIGAFLARTIRNNVVDNHRHECNPRAKRGQ
jgi:hypothetical protein